MKERYEKMAESLIDKRKQNVVHDGHLVAVVEGDILSEETTSLYFVDHKNLIERVDELLTVMPAVIHQFSAQSIQHEEAEKIHTDTINGFEQQLGKEITNVVLNSRYCLHLLLNTPGGLNHGGDPIMNLMFFLKARENITSSIYTYGANLVASYGADLFLDYLADRKMCYKDTFVLFHAPDMDVKTPEEREELRGMRETYFRKTRERLVGFTSGKNKMKMAQRFSTVKIDSDKDFEMTFSGKALQNLGVVSASQQLSGLYEKFCDLAEIDRERPVEDPFAQFFITAALIEFTKKGVGPLDPDDLRALLDMAKSALQQKLFYKYPTALECIKSLEKKI